MSSRTIREVATIEFKNYKRAPGWYWTFEGQDEPGGRCGPYKTHRAAAHSARINGFATVTKPSKKGRK